MTEQGQSTRSDDRSYCIICNSWRADHDNGYDLLARQKLRSRRRSAICKCGKEPYKHMLTHPHKIRFDDETKCEQFTEAIMDQVVL